MYKVGDLVYWINARQYCIVNQVIMPYRYAEVRNFRSREGYTLSFVSLRRTCLLEVSLVAPYEVPND